VSDFEGYQWALPESLDIPPDRLQLRLDFYSSAAVLYSFESHTIKTKMVSARDISLAMLGSVALSSGLLPPNALWWKRTRGEDEVAIWQPAKIWRVALQLEAFKPARRFTIPMPGLIFICQMGKPPRVFAAKRRPCSLNDEVYHAPLYNVFTDGSTCPGTHSYPADMSEIPASFFMSFFTRDASFRNRSKKYPNDLLPLWEELDGKKKYPLNDLVPFGHVKDLM